MPTLTHLPAWWEQGTSTAIDQEPLDNRILHFASQGEAGAWLQHQTGVTAVLSLVDGLDCFYCRTKE